MIKNSVFRITSTMALGAVLAGVGALSAAARPVDEHAGLRPSPPAVASMVGPNCPLRRIDRQLVRCDNLTGNGVSAPLFIPEL
jgi:hypothetical protein